MPRRNGGTRDGFARSQPGDSRFAPSLLFAAAKLYYDEEATQAEIAIKLGVSRATVSRLLADARRTGIVQISVQPIPESGEELAALVAGVLGLHAVYLTAPLPAAAAGRSSENLVGSVLAPAVGRALTAVDLRPGDVLLVSSGRSVYEVANFDLPHLPGVVVAPSVGGIDQPEGWFQTNEITRRIADRIRGRASYLFAPALPGPDLFATLHDDPAIQRVLHLWPHARCVLTGIGAPPMLRSAMPQFVPLGSASLREAVGDICSRFFNRAGEPVEFPGSERLLALRLEDLQRLPAVVAVAAGRDKVAPIVAAARARYFSRLVTDPATAREILTAADLHPYEPRSTA